MEHRESVFVVKAWQRLVKNVNVVSRAVWTHMAVAWRMGMMTRQSYVAMLDIEDGAMVERRGMKKATTKSKSKARPNPPTRTPAAHSWTMATASTSIPVPPPNMPRAPDMECPHPEFLRYGNAWGRFARCRRCNQRWRWNDHKGDWKLDGFYSKPSPQRQSPWTPTDGAVTRLTIHQNPHVIPESSGYQKGKGMGIQAPVTPTFRTPAARRSRAPSMTSSAAGHGLTAEALQEFDELMDEGFAVVSRSNSQEEL